MPIYEYHCDSCDKKFEKLQKFADAPLTVHEECGGPVERLISSPAFHFKGTGWYVTDYAKTNGQSPHGKEGSESKDDKSDKSGEKAEKKDAAEKADRKEGKEPKSESSETKKPETTKDSSSTPIAAPTPASAASGSPDKK